MTSKADIEKLSVERVVERLSYVDTALRILRKELGDQTALLGFTGSPWTLATFMMEGASVPKYSRALQLFREDTKTYYALAEKLTAAVTAYLKMQIATGIDALQIFDSHGGHLAPTEFQEASGRWIRDIVANHRLLHPIGGKAARRSSCSPSAPMATGPTSLRSGANVLGIDWQTPSGRSAKDHSGEYRPAGQSFAALLAESTPDMVAAETTKVLDSHARPARPHLQSRPRFDAGGKTGKYRRLGGDCEKLQMKSSTQAARRIARSLSFFVALALRLRFAKH